MMFCSGNTGLSGCICGTELQSGSPSGEHKTGSPDAHLSSKKYIMKLSAIGLLFLVYLSTYHNHLCSCREEKLWEQNQPSRASAFCPDVPKSCSYPTVSAKMQMKGAGQVLTGSWRREGPEVLLSQAGIHWHTPKH